mmetsp:Transcript_43998/g.86850  ORF Transcript_43998/g.86850 Transcript_43998/m.86850 type:complete len:84 (-) Transcript_43998:44-295(-)
MAHEESFLRDMPGLIVKQLMRISGPCCGTNLQYRRRCFWTKVGLGHWPIDRLLDAFFFQAVIFVLPTRGVKSRNTVELAKDAT